jgi:predicted phosphodiesterase
MEQTDADIMCFGHTHKPYHRILRTETEGAQRFRHAINIGSVGKPKDNDSRGCYVLLTIDEKSSISDKNSVKAEFVRFEYDIEKAAKAIEESPLPDEYADMLRKGY